MHVEVRKAGDVVIVDLQGKLTAGLGDQILRETLDELLAESWRKILLNLSAVTFLDSAGLGELVSGLKTARNLGADLKVLKASARVRTTLQLTRLLPVFDVYEDEQEAIRAFAPAGGEPSASATAIGSALITFSSTEHSGQLTLSPTSSS